MIVINYPDGHVGLDFSAAKTERLTPAEAFKIAEQICRAATNAIPESDWDY